MTQYRKKPLNIDAVQVDGAALKRGESPPEGMRLWPDDNGMQPRDASWGYVDTAHGRVHVWHGDWICAQTVDGKRDFWPCREKIFAATYEAVES